LQFLKIPQHDLIMLVEACLSLRFHFTRTFRYMISGMKVIELPFCQNCEYEPYLYGLKTHL